MPAEAANFQVVVQIGLVLETNQTQRAKSTLEPGNVSEIVSVIAEAPVVNTDTSSKGEVITPR